MASKAPVLRGGTVRGPRRTGPLLAAGVVAALVLLALAGRLLRVEDDAGRPEPPPAATAPPAVVVAAEGLRLAGRVPLTGRLLAVAVGEGAVWVLLGDNTLVRVDPAAHRVTGRLDLGAGPVAGPLAVGGGAVWVGGWPPGRALRVDPVSMRVTLRYRGSVAEVRDGVLWSICCAGEDRPPEIGRVDARTLRPRPPLTLDGQGGGPREVARFAVGPGAVWVQEAESGRIWRVPLGDGPVRSVRLPDAVYGMATGAGAVWAITGAADPANLSDPTVRLRRLDAASGAVTAVGELPGLVAGLVTGPAVGAGAVWLVGPNADLRQGGSSLLRVDPASAEVSGWLHTELALANVLAAGPDGVWVATGRPELLHVVPA
jgi:hypothetical protein